MTRSQGLSLPANPEIPPMSLHVSEEEFAGFNMSDPNANPMNLRAEILQAEEELRKSNEGNAAQVDEARRAAKGLQFINAQKQSEAEVNQGGMVPLSHVQAMINSGIEAQTERLTLLFNKAIIDQFASMKTPEHRFGIPIDNPRGTYRHPQPRYRSSDYEDHLPLPSTPNFRGDSNESRIRVDSNALPNQESVSDPIGAPNLRQQSNNVGSFFPDPRNSHPQQSNPIHRPPQNQGRQNLNPNCQHEHFQAPPNPYVVYPQPQPMYYPPKNALHNWDLKYDGTSSVERFILKVDIIRKANNLTWPYVVGNFHCLIKKPADRWYWSWVYSKQIEGVEITWEILRNALVSHFSSAQTDEDVTRLLNDKRQKPAEKFTDFFEEFMSIHDGLRVPKSDVELITILKRNVNNRLFNLTYNLQASNVDSFRIMVQKVEHDLDRRYQMYPFTTQKFKDFKKVNELTHEDDEPEEELNDEDIRVDELRVTGQGHRDNQSRNRPPNPRELHCYKCGFPGVTVPNCPKCNPQENGFESAKFGDSHSN